MPSQPPAHALVPQSVKEEEKKKSVSQSGRLAINIVCQHGVHRAGTQQGYQALPDTDEEQGKGPPSSQGEAEAYREEVTPSLFAYSSSSRHVQNTQSRPSWLPSNHTHSTCMQLDLIYPHCTRENCQSCCGQLPVHCAKQHLLPLPCAYQLPPTVDTDALVRIFRAKVFDVSQSGTAYWCKQQIWHPVFLQPSVNYMQSELHCAE